VKLSRVCLSGILTAVALVASGCGSDESRDESQLLPRDLSADLVERTEMVSAALERENSCAAQGQAEGLLAAIDRAIERDRVPLELQDELRRRANELAGSIVCVPPPPPPPPPPPTRTDDDEEEEDD
jgi:hypothetical protein